LDLNPEWFDSNGRAGHAIDVQRRLLAVYFVPMPRPRIAGLHTNTIPLRTCSGPGTLREFECLPLAG
jgi:hypothetical protein